jgi:glycosyltransferase involved in cell wall biosynthesis
MIVKDSSKLSLSIIIPTKNEEVNIVNLLDCLKVQTYQDFEIIISDANSTDNTIINVRNHPLNYKIKIIDGGLPAIGRNNGAKLSKSEILLFIDADSTVKDIRLIERSINLMMEKSYDLVTTNINCRNNKIVKFIYILNNTFQLISKLDKPYSTGMYFMIRRYVFNKLGGFDEKDQYAEDYNLSRKVDRKKFGIVRSFIYSDDRRFKKLGYTGVVKLFWKTLKNKNNENYYKEKINYFS